MSDVVWHGLCNKVCVPNKAEDLNLRVFNIITEKNNWKKSAKHISCECQCKFNGKKCNSKQNWNNGKCWCESRNLKEHHGILLQLVAKMVNI